MSTERKFKTALDETRLLMLGSQIFFGFQFNGTFQPAIETIPVHARYLDAAALLLMSGTMACLIAPSARHRIADRGHIRRGIFETTAIFAGIALLPFSLSLAIDIYIVAARFIGEQPGAIIAALFWALALTFWYLLEWIFRDDVLSNTAMTHYTDKETPLTARIEQMLTEARVVLPGAQALLGFQLLAMLTEAFDRLPRASQILHAASLGCVALTVILLIAPAAFHRIAFGGADSERFHRIGSLLVSTALLPLALGMAGDIYVATTKLTGETNLGTFASIAALLILLGLWYGYPLYMRQART